MVEGPVSVRRWRGRGDGASDVVGACAHGLGQRSSEREVGGERRRERAARAVRVAACPVAGAGTRGTRVPSNSRSTTSGSSKWPPLTTTGGRAEVDEPPRGIPRVGARSHGPAEQHLRFHPVWRDDRRERQQQTAHAVDGRLRQQLVAALGDHHRIDDDEGQGSVGGAVGDHLDDGRRGQHPGLDRVNRDVGRHGVDLCDDELRRARDGRQDADGVLRGEGGNGAEAVDAVRRKRLEIGLDSGACRPSRCRRLSGL